MRKLLGAAVCAVLAGLCACGQAAPYAEVLREHYDLLFREDIYALSRYYALYDIDGNGAKELLLGADPEGANSRRDGIMLINIYAIQNAAVRQGQFHADPTEAGEVSLFRNGTIRSIRYYEVGTTFSYFRFEAEELKFQTMLKDESEQLQAWLAGGGDENEYFKSSNGIYFRYYPGINKRVPITKEKFDRVRKEFEGDGQVVELDWKPLADYKRKG